MTSRLAVEVDSLLIGLAMPIAVALIIGAITLVKRRNNRSAEDTVVDIGDTRANRVSVNYWVGHFKALRKQGEVILDRQERILEHQGQILQELVIIKTILTSRIEHRESL